MILGRKKESVKAVQKYSVLIIANFAGYIVEIAVFS